MGFITARFNRRRMLPPSLKVMRSVAIGGVAIATATLVVTLAILKGFEREYRRAILDFNSHLVLLKAGEIEDRADVNRLIDEGRVREDDRAYLRRHTLAVQVWRNAADAWRAYQHWHARASYDAPAGSLVARVLHAVRPDVVSAHLPQALAGWLARMDAIERRGIVGATPFLYREGLMIASGVIKGVVVKGVDPTTLRLVNPMRIDLWENESLTDALADSDGVPRAILGIGLARQLHVARSGQGVPADDGVRVKLMVPTTRISTGGDHFRDVHVIGTFESGLYDYDVNFALMAIPVVQRLFDVRGANITGIELKLEDPEGATRLGSWIENRLGPMWRAVPWNELNAEIFRAVELEKSTFSLVMGILVVVAAFNIIGVLVLMIIMRQHEISVLRALGMTSRDLSRIFVRGGVAIGALGVATGEALGVGVAYLLKSVDLVRLTPEVYFLERLPIDISPAVCGMIALFCVCASWLTSRAAARKLADIPIAEGLSRSY